jgi:hypothetical protein
MEAKDSERYRNFEKITSREASLHLAPNLDEGKGIPAHSVKVSSGPSTSQRSASQASAKESSRCDKWYPNQKKDVADEKTTQTSRSIWCGYTRACLVLSQKTPKNPLATGIQGIFRAPKLMVIGWRVAHC